MIAATAYVLGEGFEPRRLLIASMVAIWGLRLGLHLLARNLHEGEDRRYAAMRSYWGTSFWWVSLGTVFLLPCILAYTGYCFWVFRGKASHEHDPAY